MIKGNGHIIYPSFRYNFYKFLFYDKLLFYGILFIIVCTGALVIALSSNLCIDNNFVSCHIRQVHSTRNGLDFAAYL